VARWRSYETTSLAVNYQIRLADVAFDSSSDQAPQGLNDEDIVALQDEPVEDIIGNHVFHLIQLAAIHLAATPPQLEQASLAIDAVGGIVDTLGDRLGEHAELFAHAVEEIRVVFERASGAS